MKKKTPKPKKNIYYNMNEYPFVLTLKWHDYNSSFIERHVVVGSGKGVDISLFGLSKKKPVKKKKPE